MIEKYIIPNRKEFEPIPEGASVLITEKADLYWFRKGDQLIMLRFPIKGNISIEERVMKWEKRV